MAAKKRNYKKEYKDFHGKPEQIKKRSNRNKARKKLGLSKGDGVEVQHKKPLSKGGGNSKSNLKRTTKTANRKEGGKIGKRKKPKVVRKKSAKISK